MADKLKILMIASECSPLVKTGGLADVVGALPGALKALGHEVIIALPKYAALNLTQAPVELVMSPVGVWMGDTLEWCAVYQTNLQDDVPVYLIESKKYFDRSGLYHDESYNDYLDNPRRFAFFTRAALQLCRDLPFKPDIVHLHDWQTALGAAYLKVWHWNDAVLGNSASVLTIHNIGYQGVYPASHYPYIGLQWENFTSDRLEAFGAINFLKGGIVFADAVNTVSPRYAWETRTPEMGWGMAPYLNNRGDDYIGILNGVDYTAWDPANDRLIPATYTPENLDGKKICKRELQQRFYMEMDETIPVIGIVSRFVDQKGLDLLAQSIESILANMRVQFAILGSGEKYLEDFFGGLPARYPGRVGAFIGYNNELAHWIEAGSDCFIMPSRYEPCGLNQIYSLRYGSLPIVRATGGLDDTVQQYNEATGEGTGFKFADANAIAIYYAVGWAVSTFYDRPDHFQRMVIKAMRQNFSWEDAAKQYLALYERALENKRKIK